MSEYKSIKTPWSTVGYLTYKRTYSRKLEGTDKTEEFYGTTQRAGRETVLFLLRNTGKTRRFSLPVRQDFKK